MVRPRGISYKREVDFEWDPAKAASNLAKHGVDFEDAIQVFADPDRVERGDPRDRGEPRFQAIGIADGIILFVSYTIRDRTHRIISARRANLRERASYPISAGD
jgi:uncharacterized DUF497 family protein